MARAAGRSPRWSCGPRSVFEGGDVTTSSTNRRSPTTGSATCSPGRHGRGRRPERRRLATNVYADCLSAASDDLGCASDAVPANVNTSPIYSDDLCPTWVSLPVEITVTNGKTGDGQIYRAPRRPRRRLRQRLGDPPRGDRRRRGVADDRATYDEWGSYDRIVYPLRPTTAVRRAVPSRDPTGTPDRPGHRVRPTTPDRRRTRRQRRGRVTRATTRRSRRRLRRGRRLDPRTGQPDVLSRVAATTTRRRLATPRALTSSPRSTRSTAGWRRAPTPTTTRSPTPTTRWRASRRSAAHGRRTPQPLVSFEYSPTAAGYAYASARHLDVFHPGDTIDTDTFADGIGRTTQTQRDARCSRRRRGPGRSACVSGATKFDALGRAGRAVPTRRAETQALGATFETAAAAGTARQTVFDLRDRPNTITAAGQPGDADRLRVRARSSPAVRRTSRRR